LGPLDNRANVETPERIEIQQELAGPGRRAWAWAVDAGIRVIATTLLFVFVLPWTTIDETLGGAAWGFFLVVLFALEWVYGIGFEVALQGRTPGTIWSRVRVVRVDGSPVGVADVVLRNLLRAADYLPIVGFGTFGLPLFGVGLLVMFADRKQRRIGDLVAGTVVVIETPWRIGEPVRIEPPITEEERREIPMRVDLSREELRVIESFLARRKQLGDQRAEELAALYGPALARRTGVMASTWTRVLTLAYARSTGADR
jgi:uncharacterized RDD family membrane protein YckC